ncbi:DUF2142 domain-containing protein [Microbacterium sp. 2C]|uniref:DUF2142 domain-containing protein n=1 Tax=Microbacterium paulum TaxID=2707006 RepID=UPI0018C24D18|nr:DUF2142 domain-containing protein [Microbacterium paulum]MBG0717964.1 DUF2142 domain-containing protein [Microbacterium paulum]
MGAPLSSGGETVDFDRSNAAASPFIAYLPAAAGFRIASWLDVGAGWAILLAKLCNAAVYVVGGWFALCLVRGLRVRWLLFAIALLPQAVFQAVYITADTYANAAALVFVAAVLRLILGRGHPPAGVIVTVAAAGLGVVLGKPSYAILLALLLAVPPSRFIPAQLLGCVGERVRRVGWSVLAGYLVVAAALTLALLRLTSDADGAH